MGEKTLSELCEAAHEEAKNIDEPEIELESENAYANEDVDLSDENKAAINRILSRED